MLCVVECALRGTGSNKGLRGCQEEIEYVESHMGMIMKDLISSNLNQFNS